MSKTTRVWVSLVHVSGNKSHGRKREARMPAARAGHRRLEHMPVHVQSSR